MSETQVVESGLRRRSRGEAERLVSEFERSGMTRVAFCRQHGLSAATLDNYRKRWHPGALANKRAVGQKRSSLPLIPVDLIGRSADPSVGSGEATLYVELASGRRIGVAAGFDATALKQLIAVLEQV